MALDPNVIVPALIGLIGTLVGAGVSAGWFTRREKSVFEAPDEVKKRALKGTWTGRQTQTANPGGQPLQYTAVIEIDWNGKLAHGNYRFTCNSGGINIDEKLPFKGGFMYGRFLKLDYYDASSGKTQFGSLLLKLDENGQELTGMDLGFGYTTKQIVGSQLTLRKPAG